MLVAFTGPEGQLQTRLIASRYGPFYVYWPHRLACTSKHALR